MAIKKKVEIYEIIRQTAGGFYSYCRSNVGIIKKLNHVIKIYKPPTEVNVEDIRLSFFEKVLKFFINLIQRIMPHKGEKKEKKKGIKNINS